MKLQKGFEEVVAIETSLVWGIWDLRHGCAELDRSTKSIEENRNNKRWYVNVYVVRFLAVYMREILLY